MTPEKNFFIAYDLILPGQDYSKIEKAIASCCSWRMKVQFSLYYCRSTMTASQIYDVVKAVMDTNDKLAVIEASNAVVTINDADNRAAFQSLWTYGTPKKVA